MNVLCKVCDCVLFNNSKYEVVVLCTILYQEFKRVVSKGQPFFDSTQILNLEIEFQVQNLGSLYEKAYSICRYQSFLTANV